MIELDKEDQWLLNSYKWHIQKTTPMYAFRQFTENGELKRVYLHRVVAKADKGQFVDHINGNGLDCRKENLRICSHTQNMQNRKVAKSNKLGVKGVYMQGHKFRASIKAFGKRHNLGSFELLQDAVDAYKHASIRLHGEFSRV